MAKPQIVSEPKPPLPKQKLEKPGLESAMKLRPRYQAPRYRAAGKLDGKVALITGGDSGIGRAVAVLFAREGADVAIAFLRAERVDARETCARDRGAGTPLPDARRRPDASAGLRAISSKRTVEAFGKLDILVSNAAHQNRKKALEEITDEEFDRTFKTNVYAYFRLREGRAAASRGRRLDHRHRIGDRVRRAGAAAGLLGDQRRDSHDDEGFAKMLAERGIRVNCVAPGPVWTPLNLADTGNPPDEGRAVWREDAAEASGAAGRARARVRLPRLGCGRELHHRGNARGDGRRHRSRLTPVSRLHRHAAEVLMTRTIWMTAAAACFAAAGLTAQQSEPKAVTLTGCVEPGTENTINTQTGPGYKLTHVTMAQGKSASSAKMGYALEGAEADLKPHLGHTVEVIGRVVPKDSSTVTGTTPVPTGTTGETKTVDNGSPRLKVSAVKMISKDCEKK